VTTLATKPCAKCKNLFPLTEFKRTKQSSDGRGSRCRSCRSVAGRPSIYWTRRAKITEEAKAMKALPLVDYMEWMLKSGKYDVDVDTGIVINCRTGKPLKSRIDKEGYPSVNLAFDGVVTRPVRVHRFIAVKLWGADAAKGNHVAHLDGNKKRSIRPNIEIKTPSAHLKHDYAIGIHKPITGPWKKSWEPCARCGDPDGPIRKGEQSPARNTGRRFGIEGDLCGRCLKILSGREYRARNGATPRPNLWRS
jgi:hypothetical protein